MIGKIDSIETMGLVDGPGIRFVVFMQGCGLRCIFCHNPETWQNKSDLQLTSKEVVDEILNEVFADDTMQFEQDKLLNIIEKKAV